MSEAGIQPIANEADYRQTLQQIEALFDAHPDTPEGRILDALVTLVEAYESRHYPMRQPDAVEAVLYYLESRGLTEADLEPILGGENAVSDFLCRARALTLPEIQRLYRDWEISADALIQPYSLMQSAA